MVRSSGWGALFVAYEIGGDFLQKALIEHFQESAWALAGIYSSEYDNPILIIIAALLLVRKR